MNTRVPSQRRTVLITGGSKGIGLATARLLFSHGMRVILVARATGPRYVHGTDLRSHGGTE